MKILFLYAMMFLLNINLLAEAIPDCSGVNNWAASMAFVDLKDNGLTTNDKLDFNKTTSVRIASEKIAKDIYRQVHLITYVEKKGKVFQLITINNASLEECSMSDVEVYLIKSKISGNED
jgi:hypothetical protein